MQFFKLAFVAASVGSAIAAPFKGARSGATEDVASILSAVGTVKVQVETQLASLGKF